MAAAGATGPASERCRIPDNDGAAPDGRLATRPADGR